MAPGLKNPPAMQAMQIRSLGWKIPWRRAWQLTPLLLPGESHGQRSLVGYSPWDHTESEATECAHTDKCRAQHWEAFWFCFAAAAAAKSLQSCPTLCNPTDSSPPGSSVPGILQARTLEWVAISFFNV